MEGREQRAEGRGQRASEARLCHQALAGESSVDFSVAEALGLAASLSLGDLVIKGAQGSINAPASLSRALRGAPGSFHAPPPLLLYFRTNTPSLPLMKTHPVASFRISRKTAYCEF